jgi:hypothetical protein
VVWYFLGLVLRPIWWAFLVGALLWFPVAVAYALAHSLAAFDAWRP